MSNVDELKGVSVEVIKFTSALLERRTGKIDPLEIMEVLSVCLAGLIVTNFSAEHRTHAVKTVGAAVQGAVDLTSEQFDNIVRLLKLVGTNTNKH